MADIKFELEIKYMLAATQKNSSKHSEILSSGNMSSHKRNI